MTIARSRQLCLDLTPYYHCISRCVRRAFLCGRDKVAKRNYNHRRKWIEEHLLFLASCFCIEIAGYSVMSNHFHVVLKVNQAQLDALSDKEVVERWLRLYKGSLVAQRFLQDEELTELEIEELSAFITRWRLELCNISRFMGNLNETIARKANTEDGCKGRFWEGRFKMQALLDTAALLKTLCYVDLNPVRAKKAKTPAQSKYTSVYRRLHKRVSGLVPFATGRATDSSGIDQAAIPICFRDYLALLDWEGSMHRDGKRGKIELSTLEVISRLGCTETQWAQFTDPSLTWKPQALGSVSCLRAYCESMGRKWIWGVSHAVS